ncbi:hypothetical protein [Oryza sativa Japonica Group]|uniref:Uncharacterized protein n=1 Tax=Oryza sativa subsp. japonica TaxID=39947 RepID=Q5VNK9_ORYSJ|nr:hypothetical protein [Oryza sativa Japonica Group]
MATRLSNRLRSSSLGATAEGDGGLTGVESRTCLAWRGLMGAGPVQGWTRCGHDVGARRDEVAHEREWRSQPGTGSGWMRREGRDARHLAHGHDAGRSAERRTEEARRGHNAV